MLAEMRKGLVRQMGLVGQFDRHYQRKEELFFPIMERYGHDSPPKVMWGVDDQIRELFQKALAIAKALPEVSISTVKADFEAFATEFESMIFKEESILLMILLESFTQDDWIQIAEESDAYGYAIIRPSEKWIPERKSFVEEKSAEEPVQLDAAEGQVQKVIDTPEGQFTITFTPRKRKQCWTAIANRLLVMAISQSSRLILFSTICRWRLPLLIKMIFSSITMTIRQQMR